MPIDPSIPLSANTGIDLKGILTLGDLAQKVRLGQQKAQAQNTLRSLFTQPGALDTSGIPTPKTIQATMAVDPETGLELQQSALEARAKQAQIKHYETEAGTAKWNAYTGARGAGVDAYDAAKKAGRSEVDAVSAGRAARNEALRNNGGTLSPDEMNYQTELPFDPAQARVLAMSNPDYSTRVGKERTEERQESMERERERHDERMEAITLDRLNAANASKSDSKWEVLTDPKTQTQYRYNPETGKATTLDGSEEYKPQGAAKMAGGTPRSASAMAIQKYIEENPNASAADIQKFAAKGAGLSSAQRALTSGDTGKQLKALGVATDHLNTLRDLNEAFKGGDEKTISAAKAAWEREFGTPAPSNMDVAAQFVAPELIKAIEGSPGGVAERDELAAKFKAARGQSNVDGAIDTAFALMGGQLNGLRNDVVNVKKVATPEEFDDMLPSTARDAMRKHATKSAGGIEPPRSDSDIQEISTKQQRDALRPGSHYRLPGDPAGQYRTKQ